MGVPSAPSKEGGSGQSAHSGRYTKKGEHPARRAGGEWRGSAWSLRGGRRSTVGAATVSLWKTDVQHGERQDLGGTSTIVKPKNGEKRRLRENHALREELRERLDCYLDRPLALASVLLALLAIIELSGELSEP